MPHTGPVLLPTRHDCVRVTPCASVPQHGEGRLLKTRNLGETINLGNFNDTGLALRCTGTFLLIIWIVILLYQYDGVECFSPTCGMSQSSNPFHPPLTLLTPQEMLQEGGCSLRRFKVGGFAFGNAELMSFTFGPKEYGNGLFIQNINSLYVWIIPLKVSSWLSVRLDCHWRVFEVCTSQSSVLLLESRQWLKVGQCES